MFASALSELDDAELVSVMRFWERVASSAAAGQLAAIAELARRRPRSFADGGPAGHADAGDPLVPQISEFAVDEVAAALRLSRPAAGARLHVAVELTRLPAAAAALADGVLDLPKARALVDAVAVLDAPTAVAVCDRVLPRAGRQTAGQLRAALSRAVLAAEPAAAEARHERAVAGRQVTLRPSQDGMAELWALLPADAAVAVYQHVDRLARRQPSGDGRGMDARRADALVTAVLTHCQGGASGTPACDVSSPDSARSVGPGSGGSAGCAVAVGSPVALSSPVALGSGVALGSAGPGGSLDSVDSVEAASAVVAVAAPGSGAVSGGDGAGSGPVVSRSAGAEAAEGGLSTIAVGVVVSGAGVLVTVPAATALGLDDEPGELAGYGPVPASMARRLAATAMAGWRKVTTDPRTGAVTAVGRTAYTPSAALADLVRTRDVTCRFPGCRRPAQSCDLDHVIPWPEGPTAAGNLAALCRHHHRLKHQTRWSVRAGPGGELLWTSPAGQHYSTVPEL